MAGESKREHLGGELLVVQARLGVGRMVGLDCKAPISLTIPTRQGGQRENLTQNAHHILAVDLLLGIHVCTLLSKDLPAVCAEEVVEVAHTGVWIHGDVSGQLEDRVGNVVPASAE